MKDAMIRLLNNIAELFKVKTLVTLSLTACLIYLVIIKLVEPAAFMSVFGSVMVYYFTKDKNGSNQ